MINYILRRLLLLPITLFFIILVNFVIINLAPGEPTSVTEVSAEGGAARRQDRSVAFGNDERYLQFREHYGLTLPILLNTWPWLSLKYVNDSLWTLIHKKEAPQSTEEMSLKDYENKRILLGDQARFIMPDLLEIMHDPKTDEKTKEMALRFFARGGTKQVYVGYNLTAEQKKMNQKIAADNLFFTTLLAAPSETAQAVGEKIAKVSKWYEENWKNENYEPSFWKKIYILFFQTRVCRYFSRVLTLNFGTLRNDPNKFVIEEVVKRFKYSLTLSITPLLMTFVLCMFFGFAMALTQNRFPDISLNLIFLTLYAIPIFVVAPFLIEKIGLNHFFPFTNIPIPINGFTSPDPEYDKMTSGQKILDILEHLFLPLTAIIYGSLAAQSRLSRTAVLEVIRQDYVRTAKAKGLAPFNILYKHVGRNAAITIVTAIAGSLGLVLGGTLIVETLFEIDGYGKFFYDAVINRDYNVIMFSALAGSFLTLAGYLVADITYTVLDPRITLD